MHDIQIHQCHDALDEIKKKYPDASVGISERDTWPDRPKGCYLLLTNRKLYWNSHQFGRPSNNALSVCRTKGI